MNRITIAGNVGKDIELKYLPSGMAVANFSVADTTGKDDKRKTMWHNVTVFGDLAENTAGSVVKGTRVVVEGRLTEDKFTNKEGVEVTRIKVLADDVSISVRFGAYEPVQPAASGSDPSDEPF